MKNINNNRNDRKIPQQTHFIGVLLPEDIVRHRSLYNASYVRPTNRSVRSIRAKCNSENIHKKIA